MWIAVELKHHPNNLFIHLSCSVACMFIESTFSKWPDCNPIHKFNRCLVAFVFSPEFDLPVAELKFVVVPAVDFTSNTKTHVSLFHHIFCSLVFCLSFLSVRLCHVIYVYIFIYKQHSKHFCYPFFLPFLHFTFLSLTHQLDFLTRLSSSLSLSLCPFACTPVSHDCTMCIHMFRLVFCSAVIFDSLHVQCTYFLNDTVSIFFLNRVGTPQI